MLERLELSPAQHRELAAHAAAAVLHFSTAFGLPELERC